MNNYIDYDYIVQETFYRILFLASDDNEYNVNMHRAKRLFIDWQYGQGEIREDYWDYSDYLC